MPVSGRSTTPSADSARSPNGIVVQLLTTQIPAGIEDAFQESVWYLTTSSLLPRFYFVTEYARVRATDFDFDHTEVGL